MAENATHTLHNLLTLRGAVVRDPHVWAHYLTEAIELFGGEAEVVFASHHWPTWGTDSVVEFLSIQRDLYAYLHDQTLRLLNQGLGRAGDRRDDRAAAGAGEGLAHPRLLRLGQPQRQGHLPALPGLVRRQPGPPVAAPAGGEGQALRRVHGRRGRGRRQGAALVRSRRPALGRRGARPRRVRRTRPRRGPQLLADIYEQLGFGSENGTWRCEFLSAATELRTGNFGTPIETASADIVAHLSPAMLFDALAIQVDGPKAWDLDLAIRWDLPDHGASYRTTLHNGVLTYVKDSDKPVGLTLTVPAAALTALAGGDIEAARSRWAHHGRRPGSAGLPVRRSATRRPQLQHHRALTRSEAS